MSDTPHNASHIMLADDDDDDRLLFNDVLKELQVNSTLTTAKNGEHLMTLLHTLPGLPDLIFLDLNMPRKNGFECLEEIKKNKRLKHLPVIIFSTSSQPSAVNQVYNGGANLYVRKPNDYANLKKIISHVLALDWKGNSGQPPKEEFVLSV